MAGWSRRHKITLPEAIAASEVRRFDCTSATRVILLMAASNAGDVEIYATTDKDNPFVFLLDTYAAPAGQTAYVVDPCPGWLEIKNGTTGVLNLGIDQIREIA